MLFNVPSRQSYVNTNIFKTPKHYYLIYYLLFIQECVDTKIRTNLKNNNQICYLMFHLTKVVSTQN